MRNDDQLRESLLALYKEQIKMHGVNDPIAKKIGGIIQDNLGGRLQLEDARRNRMASSPASNAVQLVRFRPSEIALSALRAEAELFIQGQTDTEVQIDNIRQKAATQRTVAEPQPQTAIPDEKKKISSIELEDLAAEGEHSVIQRSDLLELPIKALLSTYSSGQIAATAKAYAVNTEGLNNRQALAAIRQAIEKPKA